MEQTKKDIFKVQVSFDESGKLEITPYSNRQIPPDLINRMNDALQDVAEDVNGTSTWKKHFIEFEDNGNRYRSVEYHQHTDGDKYEFHESCDKCVFWNNDLKSKNYGCNHPHYKDGTKGVCDNIYYIREESTESDPAKLESAPVHTAKCFIRNNYPGLRIKLETLGYGPACGYLQGDCIECNSLHKDGATCLMTSELHCIKDESVDCGTNEKLFLAIAALNDQDDYNQWFLRNDDKEWYRHSCTSFNGTIMASPDAYTVIRKDRWHKATVQELIDNF